MTEHPHLPGSPIERNRNPTIRSPPDVLQKQARQFRLTGDCQSGRLILLKYLRSSA